MQETANFLNFSASGKRACLAHENNERNVTDLRETVTEELCILVRGNKRVTYRKESMPEHLYML